METLPEKLYFLGLGGMGMAPLALFLADRGHQIEGFDDRFRPDVMEVLQESNITIRNSPREDTEMLVISRAIQADHEILEWAKSRSVPILSRGEALAQAVQKDRLIAVVGSHGKTTTSAFLIHLLQRAGFPFDYILGGIFSKPSVPPGRGTLGGQGEPEWVVVEVDESDGTIDHFSPEWTLAVDWSWDHPNHYKSNERFDETLFHLFQRTQKGVWVPQEKRNALGNSLLNVHVWGREGKELPDHFPLYGEHNERNAHAARKLAESLVGKWDSDWWNHFPGIHRRQEFLGSTQKWNVYQDYAHHPDELKGLFAAIRRRGFSVEPLILFQPHRFTRTQQFAQAFAAALSGWKDVALLPVYGAGEVLEEGADSESILACFSDEKPKLLRNEKELELFLAEREGVEIRDIWFVGAGDIEGKGGAWMRRIQAQEHWGEVEDSILNYLNRARPDTDEFSKLVMQGVLLDKKTTLRVGGAARYYAEPQNRKELIELCNRALVMNIPLYLLGRGSNLLIADEGVDGLVIRLTKGEWEEIEFLENGKIRVGAGVPLKRLCGQASLRGLKGFEFLEGIPGTVGGALRMNAGAMGGWTLGIVEEVDILTHYGELRTYRQDELKIEYRCCSEVAEGIAISALMSPTGLAESEEIRTQIGSYSDQRKGSQPKEPSAGCTFKNPAGNHAGKLIDQCGLKGVRIGDAEVSRVHGNFIINRGNASSKEVLALIRFIRKRVLEEKGVLLEPEVLLWGADWEEVLK